MTNDIRRQLTLFVEPKDGETIEQVRREFNPRQFELIKSHVTLCRENEIQNLNQVMTNLLFLTQTEIVVEFGAVIKFATEKEFYCLQKLTILSFRSYVEKFYLE